MSALMLILLKPGECLTGPFVLVVLVLAAGLGVVSAVREWIRLG